MQTEFEKFWQEIAGQYADSFLLKEKKEFAEKVWHRAQLAAMRTIFRPTYIPTVGDKVKLLSMCHSASLGKIREVVNIYKESEEIIYMETKYTKDDGEVLYSEGILGEVEVQYLGDAGVSSGCKAPEVKPNDADLV